MLQAKYEVLSKKPASTIALVNHKRSTTIAYYIRNPCITQIQLLNKVEYILNAKLHEIYIYV